MGGNKREVKQKDVQHKNTAVQVSLLRTTTKKKKEKKNRKKHSHCYHYYPIVSNTSLVYKDLDDSPNCIFLLSKFSDTDTFIKVHQSTNKTELF